MSVHFGESRRVADKLEELVVHVRDDQKSSLSNWEKSSNPEFINWFLYNITKANVLPPLYEEELKHCLPDGDEPPDYSNIEREYPNIFDAESNKIECKFINNDIIIAKESVAYLDLLIKSHEEQNESLRQEFLFYEEQERSINNSNQELSDTLIELEKKYIELSEKCYKKAEDFVDGYDTAILQSDYGTPAKLDEIVSADEGLVAMQCIQGSARKMSDDLCSRILDNDQEADEGVRAQLVVLFREKLNKTITKKTLQELYIIKEVDTSEASLTKRKNQLAALLDEKAAEVNEKISKEPNLCFNNTYTDDTQQNFINQISTQNAIMSQVLQLSHQLIFIYSDEYKSLQTFLSTFVDLRKEAILSYRAYASRKDAIEAIITKKQILSKKPILQRDPYLCSLMEIFNKNDILTIDDVVAVIRELDSDCLKANKKFYIEAFDELKLEVEKRKENMSPLKIYLRSPLTSSYDAFSLQVYNALKEVNPLKENVQAQIKEMTKKYSELKAETEENKWNRCRRQLWINYMINEKEYGVIISEIEDGISTGVINALADED